MLVGEISWEGCTLAKEAALVFLRLPPPPQPPGVHQEAAGATLGLQYPGGSLACPLKGLGISLLPPHPSLLALPFLPPLVPCLSCTAIGWRVGLLGSTPH